MEVRELSVVEFATPGETSGLGDTVLLSRLAAREDALVEDLCDAAAQSVPAVAALRAGDYWFLAAHVARRTLRLLLRPVEEPLICADEATWLHRYGSRAAEYGFATADFAAALNVAVDVTLGHLARAAGAGISGPTVARLARRVNQVRDAMIENFAAGERGEPHDSASAFFQDALRGTGRNDARLVALAPHSGIDLGRPFALALLALESHDEAEQSSRLRNALADARASLRGAVLLPPPRGHQSHSLLVAPIGDAGGAMPASRWDDVVAAAGALVQRAGRPVMLSRAVTGIDPMRQAYACARRLLPLTSRLLAGGTPRLVSLEELRLHSLLLSAAPSEQDRYVEEMLGPVLRLPAAQQLGLLRALDVLCATSRLPDAARLLHVHANTVKYRREKLEELCGRSLSGDDRLGLWLALRLAHALGRLPAGAVRGLAPTPACAPAASCR